MSKHSSDRVHWQKIFRVLKDSGGRVSLLEVSKQLNVKQNDNELRKSVDQLVIQGRVTVALGKTENGTVGSIITITEKFKEELLPKSYRDIEEREFTKRMLGFNLDDFM